MLTKMEGIAVVFRLMCWGPHTSFYPHSLSWRFGQFPMH